ncbi:MAG: ATP-binding cassette domain-containing protein [Bacteroidales bacterium]|nr:ATP-binding cassette domain-containing protein [Bacteroidales bacterium]
MYYLETSHVVKQYSGHKALDDVSIQVHEGKIYGLLGPNGAGKSTLIRIINHITAPDSGQVIFNGRQMTAADMARIGYLPEERGLYKKMKVAEQAIYLARLKGMTRNDARESLRYWFDKFDIRAWADKKLGELSKGMQQKVQFIITVMHRPEFLIFDEPFSGFDPVNAQLIRNEILELKAQGATIMFSTHNMASVEEICDEIGLINRSRLVLQGDVDDIRESHRQGQYLVKVRRPADPQVGLQALDSQLYSWNSLVRSSHYWTWQLRREQQADIPAIFSQIAARFDIISFEELIPDMNEIFIKTVQNIQQQ